MTELLNTNKELLLSELRSAGATGIVENEYGAVMRCPFHDDKKPSASMKRGEDGKWRFKCFSNPSCPSGDIYDLFPEKYQIESNKPAQRVYSLDELKQGVEDCYVYWDYNSKKICLVVRRFGKDKKPPFAQYKPLGGGFVAGGANCAKLYFGSLKHRERIEEASSVMVVEGEKATKALCKNGVLAINKSGGSSVPEKADWTPLHGKEVILWPDKDDVGISYMEGVKELLQAHCKVKWIEPPEEIPDKGDAYDYCDKHSAQEVKDFIDDAKDCGVSSEVIDYWEDIISGKIVEVLWPWKQLTDMSSALIDGSTTLFVGGGGAGKSTAFTQALSYWYDNKTTWRMYALESTRRLHLTRALAMRVQDSNILKMRWVRDNPDIVRQYYRDHKDWLDGFGKNIIVPTTMIGQSDLLRWTEKDAETKRVIIIDPISIAEHDLPKGSKQPSIGKSDSIFIDACEKIAKTSGCSIINVSHPKGEGYNPSLDNIKGSASWPNFTHTVLWIQPTQEKELDCLIGGGFTSATEECPVNRILHLLKTREGDAPYHTRIGYWFDRKTLTLQEQGVIISKKKG